MDKILRICCLLLPGVMGAVIHFRYRAAAGSVPLGIVFFYSSLFLLLGYLFYLAAQRPNARARQLLSLRDAYPPEIFGARYFTGERAEIATRLRRVFDHHYDLNPTRILPSDRFAEDLAFTSANFLVGKSKIKGFFKEIEGEFTIQLDKKERQQARTFKELMELIYDKQYPPATQTTTQESAPIPPRSSLLRGPRLTATTEEKGVLGKAETRLLPQKSPGQLKDRGESNLR